MWDNSDPYQPISETYYCGSFVYTKNTDIDLEYALFEEGRLTPQPDGSLRHEYFIKDHLGNTRVVFRKEGQEGVALLQETHYYPFGMEFMGTPSVTMNVDNFYKYNGKELQQDGFDLDANGVVESRLLWYDYHARFYDPQLGRTTTQDPLAEKFFGLSPYSMFANNPLRFVDPTGMEIEEGSKKEWERQKGYVSKQRNKLQKKSDGLAAKAEKKGWSAEKLAKKQGNLGERISSLNSSLETMGNLESSTQVYRLSTPESGENSGVSLDTESKVIDISFRSTASFVHETTHAGQFETGDIAFDLNTGGTLAQDVTDEVAAYKAQFAYSPSSVSGLTSTSVANSFGSITASWVQGLAGGTLYVPGGLANTGVSPLNINSTKADFMKAFPNNATLKSLPTNFILKESYPNIYYKK